MFIEIKDIKKHFGSGENRVEVLKGINISIQKLPRKNLKILLIKEWKKLLIMLLKYFWLLKQ